MGAPNDAELYPVLPSLLPQGRSAQLLEEERGRPVSLYAASSAVLAWLLGEDAGTQVRDILAHADVVIASDLTLGPGS